MHLSRQNLMGGLLNRLPSENTPIRGPPLTPKSARRGPNCRIHSPGRRTTKTWRLRHNTNDYYARTNIQKSRVPIYYSSFMGHYHDRVNLSATNRPKIPNCILISKPHRTSSSRNPHPNPLRLYRSHYSDNRTRPSILRIILFSKH